MSENQDVVVIGGGAIGCAIAYYLAKAGVSVTLLERGELGSEASGASAGMLAPLSEAHEPGPFLDLMLASLRLYPELLAELAESAPGVEVEHEHIGVLRVATSPLERQELERRYQWQKTIGQDGVWLAGSEARELEPNLSPAVQGAVLSANEEQVNSKRLVEALAVAAQSLGAKFLANAAVLGFATGNAGKITAVRTTDETYSAGHFVLAAGPWTGKITGWLGFPLATKPFRGQMLALGGLSAPLQHIVWGTKGYLTPKRNDIIYAGTTVEDVGFRRNTTARGLNGIRRAATALVPALQEATVISSWAGLRPASADGLPILGRLAAWENVSLACGHFRNGILLTPITGKLMAQLITDGRAEADLGPFSPGRFPA